jgi:outer membrane lipoprotein-sorting protein
MIIRKGVALAATAVLLVAAAQAADPAEQRGRELAEAAQARGAGFGDMQATAEMRIRNGRGQEAVRRLRIQILDLPGDASRSLTLVEAPRDVRGTALLTHAGADGGSDQWLYLPAASRTRRIAAAGRSGPFMGSEFTYGDFSAQTPSQYHFRWLRDESLDGVPCHVLERWPREGAAHDRQIIWLDAEHLRLQRVEYLDARGEVSRVLTVTGYELHDDRHWRAARLHMRNVRTGAETELLWEYIAFRTGLSERDFEVSALQAIR